MYKFISLLVSVTIIASIIFIAKVSGNSISFNSSDFYLNLITEVIGITLSVILIEFFGSNILKYIENKKNKPFNIYLDNRLSTLIDRLNKKLSIIGIDSKKEFNTIDEFVESFNFEYVNATEKRVSHTGEFYELKRPILFHQEFKEVVNEIELISKQLPQGLPNDIYLGLLKISSQDNYKWDILSVAHSNYDSNWLNYYKDLLFDKYLGVRTLLKGQNQLKKIIK